MGKGVDSYDSSERIQEKESIHNSSFISSSSDERLYKEQVVWEEFHNSDEPKGINSVIRFILWRTDFILRSALNQKNQ